MFWVYFHSWFNFRAPGDFKCSSSFSHCLYSDGFPNQTSTGAGYTTLTLLITASLVFPVVPAMTYVSNTYPELTGVRDPAGGRDELLGKAGSDFCFRSRQPSSRIQNIWTLLSGAGAHYVTLAKSPFSPQGLCFLIWGMGTRIGEFLHSSDL